MPVRFKLLPLISLALFLTSLTQSAITYRDYNGIGTSSGLLMLISGAIGILGGGLLEFIIWLANPLFFLSIYHFYFRKEKSGSLGYSLFATCLALLFLSWKEILVSENGRNAKILSQDRGYYFWLASFLAMIVISGYAYIQEQKAANILYHQRKSG